MCRVIVVGAAGVVGRGVLAGLRSRGHDALGVDLRALPTPGLVTGDLAAELPGVLAPGDVVIDAAGQGDAFAADRDPLAAARANVDTPLVVVSAAAAAGARVVALSTGEVYGDGDGRARLDEDAPCTPRGVYAISKHAGERLAGHLAAQQGVGWVALRLGPVVSPHMRARTAIRRFVTDAAAGRPLELVGGGGQRRQFLDHRDLADALERLLERPAWSSRVYNLAGPPVTIADVAHLCANGAPRRAAAPGREEPGPGELACDRARRELGWAPRRDLATTLDELRAAWVTG